MAVRGFHEPVGRKSARVEQRLVYQEHVGRACEPGGPSYREQHEARIVREAERVERELAERGLVSGPEASPRRDSGLIRLVLSWLASHGPATAGEVCAAVDRSRGDSNVGRLLSNHRWFRRDPRDVRPRGSRHQRWVVSEAGREALETAEKGG
jgi:hypothetical protein